MQGYIQWALLNGGHHQRSCICAIELTAPSIRPACLVQFSDCNIEKAEGARGRGRGWVSDVRIL